MTTNVVATQLVNIFVLYYNLVFCLYQETMVSFFFFGNPLIVQSLMGCCGNLENNAENSAEDRGLACEVSEGNKD